MIKIGNTLSYMRSIKQFPCMWNLKHRSGCGIWKLSLRNTVVYAWMKSKYFRLPRQTVKIRWGRGVYLDFGKRKDAWAGSLNFDKSHRPAFFQFNRQGFFISRFDNLSLLPVHPIRWDGQGKGHMIEARLGKCFVNNNFFYFGILPQINHLPGGFFSVR